MSRRLQGALLLAFLLSGFSGLVFEVVWVRVATLILGVTIQGVSIILAAFMGGLALGSWLSGRLDTARFYAYSVVESLVAVTGLSITLMLQHLAAVRVPTSWEMVAIVVGTVVPTTLMGATLPLLVRLVTLFGASGTWVGGLYGTNTLGAVLGAFLTDFLLVPQLGISHTALVAALCNLAAAALGLSLKAGAAQPSEVAAPAPAPDRGLLLLLLAYALCGFSGLGLQIVWTRLLMMFSPGTTYIFSTILTVFLAGLAVGSALAAAPAARSRDPAPTFLGLTSALSVVSLSTIFVLHPLQVWLGGPWFVSRVMALVGTNGSALLVVQCLVRSAVLFGVPTVLMGAAFPYVCRIATLRSANVGAGVGQVYAANTVGAILGSLLVGFWILPELGVQESCGLLAALLLWAGLLGLRYTRETRLLVPAGVAILLGVYFVLPGDLLLEQVYKPLYREYFGLAPDSLRYYREDPYGAVAVGRQDDGYLRLIVDSVSQMGTEINGQRYARLMAHLPLVLQPDARRALVICFGTGTTVGAASTHSGVVTDCAELSPGVLGAAPLFGDFNERVWENPRVHLVVDDGRHWLREATDRYDVITSEPPTPTGRGMVNLFSADFYRLCREHLTDRGVVCQGLPLPALGDEQVRLAIRAFQEVFPNCSMWEGSATHLILLGSKSPLVLDAGHLSFADPEARRSLAEVGIDSPATLLSTFLHGPRFLRAYCGDVSLVDDDHPYIEYAWNTSVPLNPQLGHHDLTELWPQVHGFDRVQIAARAAALDDLKHLGDPAAGPDSALQYLLTVRRITAALPDNPFVLWWIGLEGFTGGGAPSSFRASQAMAFHLLMVHKDQEARDVLERVVAEAPREPMGHLCLGLAEAGLGHPDAARQAFQAGLAIFPEGQTRRALTDMLKDGR